MKKKNRLFFSFLMIITLSCGNDDTEEGIEDPIISVEEGRQLQVANLYDNQIVILQQEHINLLDVLIIENENFITTPTQASLVTLQEAWKNSFLHWKAAEIYNLGAIQSSFIHTRIHQWPVNTAAIDENIMSDTFIDSDYISTTGANVKGYGAIEYLLFNDIEGNILLEFTSSVNSERRLQYLTALIQNLREQSDLLRIFWN